MTTSGPMPPTLRSALLAPVLAALLGCSAEGGVIEDSEALDTTAASLSRVPNPAKELFVTDLSVVNDSKLTAYSPGKWNTDPAGGFSFGRLIDNLSPIEKPTNQQRSDRVMKWLRTWESPQDVNGQTIPARPLIREKVITPWKLASVGQNGNTTASCTADASTDFTCRLSFAPAALPFRLLAVVYRPDLRQVPLPTDARTGNAGQGRFVFGVLDSAKQPLPFTVIFEYMIPVSGASDIKSIAEKYHKLGELQFGKDFNDKLHQQTLAFSKWNAAPWRNSGSALLQIRTNEATIAAANSDPSNTRNGLLWEMREFVIGASGDIVPDTVKQEPPLALSGTATLAAWVTANATAILGGTHVVPATLGTEPFQAASSLIPSDFQWEVPGVGEDVRHAFALSTCNGCHRNETGTSFLHVKNRQADAASGLSTFLAEELAADGPRVADFETVLTTDWAKVKNGPGLDKPIKN